MCAVVFDHWAPCSSNFPSGEGRWRSLAPHCSSFMVQMYTFLGYFVPFVTLILQKTTTAQDDNLHSCKSVLLVCFNSSFKCPSVYCRDLIIGQVCDCPKSKTPLSQDWRFHSQRSLTQLYSHSRMWHPWFFVRYSFPGRNYVDILRTWTSLPESEAFQCKSMHHCNRLRSWIFHVK